MRSDEKFKAPAMSRACRVVFCALLIAATIVLQRFLSLRTPIIQVNFMFLPIMLAGMTLGWKGATLVSTISDLIGAILFPSGAFFIGYTLTAFLTGFTAGVCLYRPGGVKLDKIFILRLVICILIITGLLNGGLNTLWILMMSGSASNVILPIRIAKQLIMAPVMLITITALVRIFAGHLNRFAFDIDARGEASIKLDEPAVLEVAVDPALEHIDD